MVTLLCCCLLAQPTTPLVFPVDSTRHAYRAYVGIGANLGRYVDAESGESVGAGPQLNPSFVTGVQVRPGTFALAVSGLTFSTTSNQLDPYVNYPVDSLTRYLRGDISRRYYILPVLARFTLAGSEDTKLDLLTGATLFHVREETTLTRFTSARVAYNASTTASSATYARLLLGLGIRFTLTPFLELATEVRTNPRLVIGAHSGTKLWWPTNADIGLRYHFGAIKISAHRTIPLQ